MIEVPKVNRAAFKFSEIERDYGICRRTIERLVQKGLLQTIRVGPRSLRITAESWTRYLNSLNGEPVTADQIPVH